MNIKTGDVDDLFFKCASCGLGLVFCCWNMTFVDHDLMVMWWFHLLPSKWMCPWIRVLENFGKSCRFLEPKWPQHRKTIFYPVRFRGSGCTFAGSGGFGIVVPCWFLMLEKFQKQKKHWIWILRLAQLGWLDSVGLSWTQLDSVRLVHYLLDHPILDQGTPIDRSHEGRRTSLHLLSRPGPCLGVSAEPSAGNAKISRLDELIPCIAYCIAYCYVLLCIAIWRSILKNVVWY